MNVDQRAVPAPPGAKTRRKLLVPILVAAVVVLATLSGVLIFLVARGLDPASEDVSEFLSARSAVVEDRAANLSDLLLNYDATNIDQVADRILGISTGNFRQQYEELIAELGTALEEASASSRGRVLEAPTVTFRSASEAVAIVSVT